MKNRILFVLVLVLLFSFYSKASASELCSSKGYTILTINGIFTDETGAIKNKNSFKNKFSNSYNNQPLTVDYLYNPTHVAGVGDVIDYVQQGFFDEKSDYDLTEILDEASERVTTQKLLLVGHSQGNFYANNFYDKVASQPGGVPEQSIGVYGVATPASRVAGGGKYLTSDTDKVIASLVGEKLGRKIMTPNTHIDLKNGDGNGHDFSGVYLKYKSDQIVSDIKSSLDELQENDEQNSEDPCIFPPEITIFHKAYGILLASTDFIIDSNKDIIYKITINNVQYVASVIENSFHNLSLALANIFSGLSANVVKSLPDNNSLTTILPNISESIKDGSLQKTITLNTSNKKVDTVIQNIPTVAQIIPTINTPFHFFYRGGKRKSSTTKIPVCSTTYINNDITEDTIWDSVGCPYIIENSIIINAGVTLTINPGVVVKFSDNTGLDIFGKLIAEGTEDQKISFTSLSGLSSADWNGLFFLNSTESSIKNATFKYAQDVLYSDSSSVTFDNVEITDSDSGIALNKSTFSADGVDCVGLGGSCLVGYNNSIVSWKNSTIDNPGSDAIDIYNSSTLNISNTSFDLNSDNSSAIVSYGNCSVTADNLSVSSSSNLSSDVIEVFSNSNLNLINSLISNIGDGHSALLVFNNSIATVDNLEINSNFGESSDAIEIYNNTNFTLKNSRIKNSSSLYESTIAIFDSSDYKDKPSVLTVEKTLFEGGANVGINIYNDKIVSVINSIFKNFSDSAIKNNGTVSVDAENNFWDDESGPYNLTLNSDALGEEVSDNVSFSPWCTNEECTLFASLPVLSSLKEINTFNFAGLSPEVDGVINEADHTISLTVPFGIDVASLVPSILISDKASISPANNVAQDFTSPVTYTVTAEDSSTQDYIVTVVISPDPNIVTQLKIITSPQTINVDTASNIITVETQNSLGELTKVSSATHVNLSSSSAMGLFTSASASSGLCGSDWTKTQITVSTGNSHKSFCYKDSASGTPIITVSADGLTSDSQVVIVN